MTAMAEPAGSAARGKLIVALDLPSAEAAARMAEKLHGRVGMFKVGSELFTAEGPVLARYLVASGEPVFLDLKFHDIPNTVRAAVREAAGLGVSIVDVHASGGRRMMEAALEGARDAAAAVRSSAPRPLVLAVTVLTSLATQDLEEVGIAGGSEDAVVRMAQLAERAGLDGVIASPRELAALRRACGPRFVIVTPGIRPAAAASNDQSRVATPAAAIRAGADYLVVGRPITEAPDPAAAAEAIVAEMQAGLEKASPQAAATTHDRN
jgi:orotidine-5'-phosphate decarboxylase